MKRFIAILAVLVLCAGVFYVWDRYYNLSDLPVTVAYEYVGRIDGKQDPYDYYWFDVNADRKWISADALNERYDTSGVEMDFDRYTYIVADGYDLLDLYYIPADCYNRFHSPGYYGHATLRESPGVVNVYRISAEERVTIDKERHKRDDYRTRIVS